MYAKKTSISHKSQTRKTRECEFRLHSTQRIWKQRMTQCCPKGIQLSSLIFFLDVPKSRSVRRQPEFRRISPTFSIRSLPHLPLPHISLRHRCLISQTTVTLQNPSTPNWRSRQRAASTSTESNRTGGQAFYAPSPLAQSRWPPSRVPRVALAVYREWVRNRQRILIYNTSARGYCRLVKQHLDPAGKRAEGFSFWTALSGRGVRMGENWRHSSVEDGGSAVLPKNLHAVSMW